MRYFVFVLLALPCFAFTNWHYNLQDAKTLAASQHRYILLNFSGSDWCGPCIRMHKEIFGNEAFSKFADTALIMVNADFPRMSKNQLPAKQQSLNDAMADKYNANGSFPLTLLLNADGKVLKKWEGFPNETPEDFVFDIKTVINAQ